MRRLNDLTGERFGNLSVIRRADNAKDGSVRWECVCDCGNELVVSGRNLKSGHTRSCTQCGRKRIAESAAVDLTGEKFWMLTAIRMCDGRNNGSRLWECDCECGNTKIVSARDLRRGATKSCGCMKKDHPNHETHGRSKTRMYKIWLGMRRRTRGDLSGEEKNKRYKDVGMCDRWYDDFEAFYEDMSDGYDDTLTIDRIDNKKGYEPDNCRWSSPIEQANNKTNNIYVSIDGIEKTLAEWCRASGVPYKTAYMRLRRYGWSVDDILKPVVK